MNSISTILFTASLLIVLPVGYFAVMKSKKSKEGDKPNMGRIVLFLLVFVLVFVLAVNLNIMLINHDERIVAERYTESLVKNSVRGDETSFLADVKTIAYEMDNADAVYQAAAASGAAESNGILISRSEQKVSSGERILYALTQDQKLCLKIELRRSGYFYDVFAVTVLDDSDKAEILAKEQFSLVW